MMTDSRLDNVDSPDFNVAPSQWQDDELLNAVKQVCTAALKTPHSGFKLMGKEEDTRAMLRKALHSELSGQWESISTPEDASGRWWQIELKNGSVIRVCRL